MSINRMPLSHTRLNPFSMTKMLTSNNLTNIDVEKSIENPNIVDSDEVENGEREAIERWNAMSLEQKSVYEKKLLRKLDWRLIPWIILLYLLSFLDRTNIGNAKILGVLDSNVND